MKNAGVFLGSLGLMLTCNLMLISVCSSSPLPPVSAAPPPPPPAPAPVVKIAPTPPTIETVAPPLGLMIWGCGAHRFLDPEAALPLPICAPMLRF